MEPVERIHAAKYWLEPQMEGLRAIRRRTQGAPHGPSGTTWKRRRTDIRPKHSFPKEGNSFLFSGALRGRTRCPIGRIKKSKYQPLAPGECHHGETVWVSEKRRLPRRHPLEGQFHHPRKQLTVLVHGQEPRPKQRLLRM
jgi:hypothetical protein